MASIVATEANTTRMASLCFGLLFGIFSHALATSYADTASIYRRDFTLEISHNLSHALLDVINTAFLKQQRRVFNFYGYVLDEERRYFFGDIMDYTLQRMPKNMGVRVGMDEYIPGDDERHYCVMLVDSAESLRALYTLYQQYHLYTNGYFIIVLYTFESDHYYDKLFHIFELNWGLEVINVNVLVYALSNLILLYSIVPFSRFHCKGLSPAIQNKFIDSRWLHTDFYPDRLANLYGCPLTCATWQEPPHFELVPRGGHPGQESAHQYEFMGIEGKLLEYVSLKMNFTMEFRWLNDEEIVRTLDSDGTIFEELFGTEVDFVMGPLPYKPTSPLDPYAPTTPYYLSNLNFIVSSNSARYTPFRRLLLPFLPDTWALVLSMLVGGVVASFGTKFCSSAAFRLIAGRGNDAPVYNMFVVALGGTASRRPRRNLARFLLLLWLLHTMVLRCAYQAFMYHFVKANVGVPPPSTIIQLLQQHYDIRMSAVALSAVQPWPQLSAAVQLLNGTQVENFDLLRQGDTKLAILTLYEYFDYYKRTHVQTAADFHVVQEQLFTQQLSFYMRSNSMLLGRFNRHILEYSSAGLAGWLEGKAEMVAIKRHVRNRVNEEPPLMRLHELYGALLLLLAGAVLGCLCFLGEILMSRTLAHAGRFRSNRQPV